ncbi:hypothetical protein SARC_17565, partial [Sphaeroforma arctica JP610]
LGTAVPMHDSTEAVPMHEGDGPSKRFKKYRMTRESMGNVVTDQWQKLIAKYGSL